MAVASTGTVGTHNNTSASGSFSATIPADATLLIVTVSGFVATANVFSGGTITLAGTGMTVGHADDTATDRMQSCIFYLKNPTTGSATLAYTWLAGMTAGFVFHYRCYNGNDNTTPIRSSGGQASLSSNTATTGSMSANSGDMVVACGGAEANGTTPTGFTYSNLTEIQKDTNNSNLDAYTENSPSGSVTCTVTQTGGTSTLYTNISAVVIAGTGAVAPAPSVNDASTITELAQPNIILGPMVID